MTGLQQLALSPQAGTGEGVLNVIGQALGEVISIFSTYGQGAEGESLGEHMLLYSWRLVAGESYNQQIEAGVDHETARTLSVFAGVLGVGVEYLNQLSNILLITSGGTAAPGVMAMKAFGKAGMKKVVQRFAGNPIIQTLTRSTIRKYGAAVATSVMEEVAQEIILTAVTEYGKMVRKSKGPVKPFELNAALENISHAAVLALTASSISFGAVGAAKGLTSRFRASNGLELRAEENLAQDAVNDAEVIDKFGEEVSGELKESGVADELLTRILQDKGIDTIYIPTEALVRVSAQTGQDLSTALGVEAQVEISKGEVAVDVGVFAEKIVGTDLWKLLRDDIRLATDKPSVKDAKETLEYIEEVQKEAEADTAAQEAEAEPKPEAETKPPPEPSAAEVVETTEEEVNLIEDVPRQQLGDLDAYPITPIQTKALAQHFKLSEAEIERYGRGRLTFNQIFGDSRKDIIDTLKELEESEAQQAEVVAETAEVVENLKTVNETPEQTAKRKSTEKLVLELLEEKRVGRCWGD